ncbi:hypothetical protein ACN47E_005411 [Coniothyrium glycines]
MDSAHNKRPHRQARPGTMNGQYRQTLLSDPATWISHWDNSTSTAFVPGASSWPVAQDWFDRTANDLAVRKSTSGRRRSNNSILHIVSILLGAKCRDSLAALPQLPRDFSRPSSELQEHLPMEPVPSFHKFMDLPAEVRQRIYGFALSSDRPIVPHLCDHSLKFHDDGQWSHNAIDQMLGITRVSRKIREESLRTFYAANTFYVGADTTTYFARLEHLGRFHMIRHVQFDIPMSSPDSVAVTLRCFNQYIKEAEAYEAGLQEEASEVICQRGAPWCIFSSNNHNVERPSTSCLIGATHSNLSNHPQYQRGGIPELNTLIAMRKLTSAFTSPSTTATQRLVLPIPSTRNYNAWTRLSWFSSALNGLGIHLHFLEGINLDHVSPNSIRLTWHQKYQKKEHGSTEALETVPQFFSAEQVRIHALDLYPDLDKRMRCRVNCFYRKSCDEQRIRWFDVYTEGGGIF